MSQLGARYALMASTFLSLALPIGSVWAQAATDVNCDGCVQSSDIATNGVRRANIQNFSINTPKLNNFAVTSEKIKTGAVTETKIAAGAVGVTQIDPTQVQMRVGGSCPAGTAMASIAQDGSVVCQYLESTGYSIYSDSGVVGGACPVGTALLSANCDCNNVNGTRNFGVLFSCQVSGNGGVAGCFNEAGTYNPNLPAPRATLNIMCLTGGTIAGSMAKLGAAAQKGSAATPTEDELNARFQSTLESVTNIASVHAERLQVGTR